MWKTMVLSTIVGGVFVMQQTHSCNEALCGPIVSLCLVTGSCKCTLSNCTCCNQCYSCLSHLYSACCACVDLCLEPNSTSINWVSNRSHVEEVPYPLPGLFNVLTYSADPSRHWDVVKFPSNTDPNLQVKIQKRNENATSKIASGNCTVAFIPHCMRRAKCMNYCTTMGASSFRWFHNGCCECVGSHCGSSYGISESRCRQCPHFPKRVLQDSDMCPKTHVEDFLEPVPSLFAVLTEIPDPENRWDSLTYPIDMDLSQYRAKTAIKLHKQSAEQEVAPIKSNILTVNCTVAFQAKCMNWHKCRNSCLTMGASSFRWFHDGCCECIGQHCINYGVKLSLCRECPQPSDEENEVEDEQEDDDADYGQNVEDDHT